MFVKSSASTCCFALLNFLGIGNIKIKGSCDWRHWSFKVIYIVFSETEKPTYFTAAYQPDQDVKDTLLLGEHVIKAFKSDHPDVVEVYSKCDNASSYHGNFYPESLYHICKQNGITLQQLDHNRKKHDEMFCWWGKWYSYCLRYLRSLGKFKDEKHQSICCLLPKEWVWGGWW